MAQTSAGAIKIAAKFAGITVDEYSARKTAGLKKCTKCKEWKAVADFDTDRSRHDLLTAACTPCRRVKVRINRKGVPTGRRGRRFVEAAIAAARMVNKGNKYRVGKRHTEKSKKQMSTTKLARRLARG